MMSLFVVFLTGTLHTTEDTPVVKIVEVKEVKKEVVIPQNLLDISYCESRGRQFNSDGSVYRGTINNQDVGRWQINEYYWLKKSKELGFDIYTENGNRDMAIWIYNKYGAKPWGWSAQCHKHY